MIVVWHQYRAELRLFGFACFIRKNGMLNLKMSVIYEFCSLNYFDTTKYFFLNYSYLLLKSKVDSRKDKHIRNRNKSLHFL